MLKVLVILAVIVIGTEKPLPMNQNDGQEHSQSQCDQACELEKMAAAEVAKEQATNRERYTYYKSHKKEYFEDALAPANFSNWILAFLGSIAALIGGLTIAAIKRQADIQAAGMRQWVEVACISSSVRDRYPPTEDGDRLAKSIGVHFSVSNKTNYPLTINEVLVYISPKRLGEPVWEQYTRTEEALLAPKSVETATDRVSMSDYNFAVSLDLDVAQAGKYKAQELMFSVTGNVRFKPAVGDAEDQRFGFLVKSGPNLTRPLVEFTELKRGEKA